MQLQFNAHRDILATQWMGNKDLQFLGLSGPVELNGIKKGLDDSIKAPVLENVTIESSSGEEAIHGGILKTVIAKGNESEEPVLIEYKYYVHPKMVRRDSDLEADMTAQLSSNTKKVNNLAALLRVSGKTHMGTLPLKGIVDQSHEGRHAFIFEYPTSTLASDPITLNSLITTTTNAPLPLALRLHIAQFLARTLASFHIDDWVHKDIRSQSLVFFSAKKPKPSSSSLSLQASAQAPPIQITSPYLVNFEYARPVSGSTALFRDDNEAKDIYRHPAVQADAEKKTSFNVAHDIYSLGVVLLEIAVWQTAQAMVDASKPDDRRLNSKTIRQLYIDSAEQRLPFLTGTEYTDAVLACLGDDFKDEYKKADFAATFRRNVVDKIGATALVRDRGSEW
jgi:serine/threonine protein kinase